MAKKNVVGTINIDGSFTPLKKKKKKKKKTEKEKNKNISKTLGKTSYWNDNNTTKSGVKTPYKSMTKTQNEERKKRNVENEKKSNKRLEKTVGKTSYWNDNKTNRSSVKKSYTTPKSVTKKEEQKQKNQRESNKNLKKTLGKTSYWNDNVTNKDNVKKTFDSDIAPVTPKQIAQKILSTPIDLERNLAKGAGDTFEGVVDVGTGLLSVGAKKLGFEEASKSLDEFTKKKLGIGNAISNVLPSGALKRHEKHLMDGGTFEDKSMSGEFADQVAQGVGQLGAQVGASIAGLPSRVFIGLSAAGGGIEHALNSGGSTEEATAYGALVGVTEAVIEFLSGGIGGTGGNGPIDKLVDKALGKVAKTNTAKTVGKWLANAVGEGEEEALAETLDILYQNLTYRSEAEIGEIINDPEKRKEFVSKVWNELTSEEARKNRMVARGVGAAVGGIANVPRAVHSITTERDYDTNLTENEQKVVDRVVEKEVEKVKTREAEKQNRNADIDRKNTIDKEISELETKTGKTLSDEERANYYDNYNKTTPEKTKATSEDIELDEKEIQKIRDKVTTNLYKGYLNTSDIEETLAGEEIAEIKAIDDRLSNETLSTEELNDLTTRRNELLTEKNNKMKDLVKKDHLLQNSYYETRMAEKPFEYDVHELETEATKDLAEQFKKVKGNDTRTHELFDYLNMYTNKTGVKVRVLTEQELKDAGLAHEGKATHGYFNPKANELVINADSKRTPTVTMVHEMLHSIKDTDNYSDVAKFVKNFAEMKGELNIKEEWANKVYSDRTQDQIDEEVVAELLGDYLGTDEQFLKDLADDEPGIFNGMFNTVKRFFKMATKGSAEERELEKVKDSFKNAYKELSDEQKAKMDEEVKKVKEDSKKAKETEAQKEETKKETKKPKEETKKETKKPKEESKKDKPKEKSGKAPANDDKLVKISKSETKKRAKKAEKENTPEAIKARAAKEATELRKKIEEKKKQAKKDSDVKLSQSFVDSEGNELSPEQIEFFKDSKARDKDGNLQVLYHGTAFGEFYTFDKEKAFIECDFGCGFYFSDNEYDVGANYEGGGPDFENKIERLAEEFHVHEDIPYEDAEEKAREELYKGDFLHEVYLNIKNPAIVGETYLMSPDEFYDNYDIEDFDSEEEYYEQIEQDVADTIDEIVLEVDRNVDIYGGTDGIADVLWQAYYEGGVEVEALKDKLYTLYLETDEGLHATNETTRMIVESLGYDGIIDPTVSKKFNMNLSSDTTHYIAFKPEQIKATSNKTPTNDSDIRFSLSEAVEETEDLIAYHSIDRGDFRKMIELDGSPMPSIGVTIKENIGKWEFGEMSLIIHKDFFDPKKSKLNNLYAGDAFTPMFPPVSFKVNNEVLSDVVKYFNSLYEKAGLDYRTGVEMYPENVESRLYADSLYDAFRRNKSVRLAHFVETLPNEPVPVKQKFKSRNFYYPKDLVAFTEDIENRVDLNEYDMNKYDQKMYEKFEPAVRESLKKIGYISEENYQKPLDFDEVYPYIEEAKDYKRNGLETEIDFSEIQTHDKINELEFVDWVENVFKDIIEKKGIENGKDRFTPIGNARKWEYWHDPLTLENVLKAMKKTTEQGEFSSGKASVKGAVVQKFKSIPDAKANASVMKDYDIDKVSDEWEAIEKTISDLAIENKVDGISSYDLEDELINAMTAGSKNAIKSRLSRIDSSLANDELAGKLADILKKARSIPVDYFEAKPKKALKFEDVGVFIVPVDLDQDLKDWILDHGFSMAEYDPEVEGDRTRVTWSYDEYKFSKSDEDEGSLYDIAPFGNINNQKGNENPDSAIDEIFPELSGDVPLVFTNDYIDEEQLKMFDEFLEELHQQVYNDKEKMYQVFEVASELNKNLTVYIANGDITNSVDRLLDLGLKIDDIQLALLQIKNDPGITRENISREEEVVRKFIDKMIEEGWFVKKDDVRKQLLPDLDELKKIIENVKIRKAPVPLILDAMDTIRIQEKVFGIEGGRYINEHIFKPTLRHDHDKITFENTERDIIRKLGIKPGSKMSADVQLYAEQAMEEVFIVPLTDEEKLARAEEILASDDPKAVERKHAMEDARRPKKLVPKYDENWLAKEYPNVKDQEKIKHAAEVFRDCYDRYIDMMNEVYAKFDLPPIKKRSNYMHHMLEHTKDSGIPLDISVKNENFNPDSAWANFKLAREGEKSIIDAVTAMDHYISVAGEIIYHTEDIQRAKAFEDYILTEFKDSKNEDLATYTKWLERYRKNISGKSYKLDTILRDNNKFIDTIMNALKKTIGLNYIGGNISSSLTNFAAMPVALSKTKKTSFTKALVQSFANTFHKDGFEQSNPFLNTRLGSEHIAKTKLQKAQDKMFFLMSATDRFVCNTIVRAKYNECISKGMTSEQAHAVSSEFGARTITARQKGYEPLIFQSKMASIFLQFQIEVKNNVNAVFHDTAVEAKDRGGDSRMAQAYHWNKIMAEAMVATWIFCETFEKMAGYRPALDLLEVIRTLLGIGEDEDDYKDYEERGFDDRAKDAVSVLFDGLPYISLLTDGGRYPLKDAMPNLLDWAAGKENEYGQKVKLSDELKKLPMLLNPIGGSNQIKKTVQGLSMFDEKLPMPGSYTKKGEMRFPIDDTLGNRVQAGIFGQWANDNAGKYFSREEMPLSEDNLDTFQQLKETGVDIVEYWKARRAINKVDTNEEKAGVIYNLDMTNEQKYILLDAYKISKDHFILGKMLGDYSAYSDISEPLGKLKADKDANGKSIRGSKKTKVLNYLNELDADYEVKLMFWRKSGYKTSYSENIAIINYINNSFDNYEDRVVALEAFDFIVDENGNISWE